MNASLRLRLALLVVCSVALTVALVLYLTWQRVGETMIGMEEKNFATLLLVEEERLNTATLNHLAAKVRSVLLRKAQLRDTSARVQALLRALAPQHPAGSGQAHLVLQPLLSAMDAASIALVDDVDSIRMEILDTEKLRSGQTSLLGLSSSLRDAKQRPVQRLLKQLSRDGDFAVFDLPRLVATNEGRMVPSGTYRPVLTYFLPLDGHRPSREILVSMIPLDDLEKMAVRAQTQLLEDTREKFREMSLYPGGLVALLDGDGHILVSGGDGLLPDGLDAARLAGLGDGGLDVVVGKTDDGGHAADADGHGALHGLGAEAHETHGRLKGHRACGAKSRIFAERMARHHFRRAAAGGEPRFIEGDRRGEHRRLGIDRERKRFGGAFGNEAGERKAERLVGAGHHAGDGLVAGKARQHTDALAALAGKHECNAHGTGPMG